MELQIPKHQNNSRNVISNQIQKQDEKTQDLIEIQSPQIKENIDQNFQDSQEIKVTDPQFLQENILVQLQMEKHRKKFKIIIRSSQQRQVQQLHMKKVEKKQSMDYLDIHYQYPAQIKLEQLKQTLKQVEEIRNLKLIYQTSKKQYFGKKNYKKDQNILKTDLIYPIIRQVKSLEKKTKKNENQQKRQGAKFAAFSGFLLFMIFIVMRIAV